MFLVNAQLPEESWVVGDVVTFANQANRYVSVLYPVARIFVRCCEVGVVRCVLVGFVGTAFTLGSSGLTTVVVTVGGSTGWCSCGSGCWLGSGGRTSCEGQCVRGKPEGDTFVMPA